MTSPVDATQASRTRDLHDDDDRRENKPIPPTQRSVDWNAQPVHAAHDDEIGAMARANKDVLYLGVNEDTSALHTKQNDAEFKALQREVATQGAHAVRIDASFSSIVGHDGRMFNMMRPGQARAFVDSLGIPDAKTRDAITHAIENAEPEGRDELARIAEQWSRAEIPGSPEARTVPSRLVISGHCGRAGTHVYDGAAPAYEMANKLRLEDVQALAKAMPHAAAQVQHVMLSACSSLREDTVAAWREALPALQSIQGYGGPIDYHSPSGALAIEHERRWLTDTTGASAPHLRSDRDLAFGSHVTLWTRDGHYQEAKPR